MLLWLTAKMLRLSFHNCHRKAEIGRSKLGAKWLWLLRKGLLKILCLPYESAVGYFNYVIFCLNSVLGSPIFP